MKLYCVRHGEACTPEEDPHCGLNEAGRKAIENLGHHLVRCGIEVPHIMHSTKLRAKQTAQILGKTLSSEVNELETVLDAESEIEPVIEMLSGWNEDTMLVGHLPYMHKLVSELVIQDEFFYPILTFPPGNIVCLEYYEGGRWMMKWVLSPSIVPQK